MRGPASSQSDLFMVQPEPFRKRAGRKPHVPSLEQRLIANELNAAGSTWPTIAGALGVSVNTLARHYFASDLAKRPKGRRCHSPTPARRKIVLRAVLGGMTLEAVANLIGVSLPTLRLHYRSELRPVGAAGRETCSQ